MTININSIQRWIVETDLAPLGSQRANDLAARLVDFIRSEGEVRTRNVHEKFLTWSTEDVVTTISETRSDIISVFLNVAGDFNMSTGVRNMNWFNGHSVWIVGRRSWDSRGAVGTQHYTEIVKRPDIFEAIAELRSMGYRIVAAEITDEAIPLPGYMWNKKTAVIYGEESAGLSQEVLDAVDDVVYIPGNGSVRSLNVGTTSGIFIYDYTSKTSSGQQ